MASNLDKRQTEIENDGQFSFLRAKQQQFANTGQQSVKKVFGELKNVMQVHNGAFATPCAGKAPGSVRRNEMQLPQKQSALNAKLAQVVDRPTLPDAMDYYLIDGLDTRKCCSKENYKPDWAVWAEMNGREFEDSGVCNGSFSFQEDSNDSFFKEPLPSMHDLYDMDESLPLFDSMLLDEKDLEDIQFEASELPEMPPGDDSWFCCSSP